MAEVVLAILIGTQLPDLNTIPWIPRYWVNTPDGPVDRGLGQYFRPHNFYKGTFIFRVENGAGLSWQSMDAAGHGGPGSLPLGQSGEDGVICFIRS
jgi:hypothetical protein